MENLKVHVHVWNPKSLVKVQAVVFVMTKDFVESSSRLIHKGTESFSISWLILHLYVSDCSLMWYFPPLLMQK